MTCFFLLTFIIFLSRNLFTLGKKKQKDLISTQVLRKLCPNPLCSQHVALSNVLDLVQRGVLKGVNALSGSISAERTFWQRNSGHSNG